MCLPQGPAEQVGGTGSPANLPRVVSGLAVDSALSGLPGVQFGVNWSWFLKKKTSSVGGPEGLAVRDNRYANASGGGHGWLLPGRLPLSVEPFTPLPWASL